MHQILLAGTGELSASSTTDYPRPDRLVKGNPQRKTQSLYEHHNMNCGFWQCEVGAWNIVFAGNKQEFFQIISGKIRIHDAHGKYIDISAGQAGVIPPGFQGTFEVLEAVHKYFVVVEV